MTISLSSEDEQFSKELLLALVSSPQSKEIIDGRVDIEPIVRGAMLTHELIREFVHKWRIDNKS
ncbi:hypothetical protein [Carnimonas bestiolae]|uniref:hypothetical protein n=1 Tax=Carnimonas bestiolae TaxID=3402172 RepID=UPI003EDC6DFE